MVGPTCAAKGKKTYKTDLQVDENKTDTNDLEIKQESIKFTNTFYSILSPCSISLISFSKIEQGDQLGRCGSPLTDSCWAVPWGGS